MGSGRRLLLLLMVKISIAGRRDPTPIVSFQNEKMKKKRLVILVEDRCPDPRAPNAVISMPISLFSPRRRTWVQPAHLDQNPRSSISKSPNPRRNLQGGHGSEICSKARNLEKTAPCRSGAFQIMDNFPPPSKKEIGSPIRLSPSHLPSTDRLRS